MTWVYLMINLAVISVAGFLGWRSRGLKVRRFFLCAAGAAIVMGLRAFLYAHPEYEQYLLALSDDYVYFAVWEAPVVMLMVFGLAARLESGRLRRLMVLMLVLLAPVFLWDSFAACVRPDYSMPARFDADGVCRQGTSYSCGPAAGVMLLRLAGEDISEGEMAELCLLRPNEGVTALELCRGLNIALRPKNQRATIQRAGPDQLARLRPPFLAEIRRPGSAEHCVVVLEIRDNEVVFADPAYGRFVSPKKEFLSQWANLVITVEPPPNL